jgi:hypothetical protein
VGSSLFITVRYFTHEVNSEKDLTEITGKLSYYSFEKVEQGGRRRLGYDYYYYVKLENYKSIFKIKENYLSEFNKVDFERRVRTGENVTITIPNSQVEELNFKDEIYLTSIKVGSVTYLQAKRVIAKENSSTNLFYAVALLLVGFIVFILRGRLQK